MANAGIGTAVRPHGPTVVEGTSATPPTKWPDVHLWPCKRAAKQQCGTWTVKTVVGTVELVVRLERSSCYVLCFVLGQVLTLPEILMKPETHLFFKGLCSFHYLL